MNKKYASRFSDDMCELVLDGVAVLALHPARYGDLPVPCNCFALLPN